MTKSILVFLCVTLLFSYLCQPTLGIAFKKDTNTTRSRLLEILFVGSDTGINESGGIYTFAKGAAGDLIERSFYTNIDNPTFITVSPNNRFLYSVSNRANGNGEIHAFLITNEFKLVLTKVYPLVQKPVRLAIGSLGSHLYVTSNNPNGVGSVNIFKINIDGTLIDEGALELGGTRSHIEDMIISKDNRHALVCNMGEDKIHIIDIDQNGALHQHRNLPSITMHAGSEPRSLIFDNNERFVYVVGSHSDVTVYDYDSNSGLIRVLTGKQFNIVNDGNSKSLDDRADVYMHPNGRHLYTTNQETRKIRQYLVLPTGGLEVHESVDTFGLPRFITFDIEGSHLYVSNGGSNTIISYNSDRLDGKLTFPVTYSQANFVGPENFAWISLR